MRPFHPSSLTLPLMAAPMFLVSGPELVIAACRNGVVGSFPALNRRSTADYEIWLHHIDDALALSPSNGSSQNAPFAVNLIVHKSNPRLAADLEVTVRHRVPIVITSLGAVRDVVDAVHSYGGIVLHDVTSVRHAERALAAGVDGLIAVAAGAGGHAGTLNPFALVSELRAITDKIIVLAGAVSHGGQVAAALAAGADMATAGTRFIATRESLASSEYKDLLLQTAASGITYTPKVSGINANFITKSIADHGISLDDTPDHGTINIGEELNHEAKAWKDIWSAGHGVGSISSIPSVDELCASLRSEYEMTLNKLAARLAS